MTVTTTSRVGITRWSAGTDAFTRAQMDASHAAIEANVALYAEGTFAARPAAGKAGRLYRATDTGGFYWDTGAVWLPIGQDLRIYGDASDGTVTLAANKTLDRDYYYDTLVIPASFTVFTNGYRLFARTLLQVDGIIDCSGDPGGAASAGPTIGNPGAQAPMTGWIAWANSLAGRGTGGVSANTVTAVAGTTQSGPPTNSRGGAGGAGGAAGAAAGGAGQVPTVPPGTMSGFRDLRNAVAASLITASGRALLQGGGGGGSGAVENTGAGGQAASGGSGGGGGVLVVAAPRITGTGTIRANGGIGGAGFTNGNAGSKASGSGGGGGGVVIVITEDTVAPAVQANGGAGAAGVGAGSNAGTAGAAGTVLTLRSR